MKRASFKRELREYNEHCRMMSNRYKTSLRRLEQSYFLKQAEKFEEEAKVLLDKSQDLRNKHEELQESVSETKILQQTWIKAAGICRYILEMPPHQAKTFLIIQPKAAVKYFLLLWDEKKEESERYYESALQAVNRTDER